MTSEIPERYGSIQFMKGDSTIIKPKKMDPDFMNNFEHPEERAQYTDYIDYLFVDDQELLEVSNDKSVQSSKNVSAGLYFCNSKMNPGVACATKAESIKYFKEHNLTI